jgi:hypothetical protein
MVIAPVKKRTPYQTLKDDPDLKEAMIPVPDYGMVTAILLMRMEKKIDALSGATLATSKTKKS